MYADITKRQIFWPTQKMLPRTVLYHRAETCTAAYSSRDTVVGKQRQMLSSILSPPHPPPSPLSVSLYILFSHSFSREAEALINIRISVCLTQFLLGYPGAQVQSGSVSICMEIGFSPGMHRGHSSTYAAHVRTYQDSAGGRDVCVSVRRNIIREKKTDTKACLFTETNSFKTVKSIWGLIPSYMRRCLWNVLGMFSVSCAQTAFRFEKQDYSLSYRYINALTMARLLLCWCFRCRSNCLWLVCLQILVQI